MTIHPPNLAVRLWEFCEVDLAIGVTGMQTLFEEVWDRVDRELPQIAPVLRDRWFCTRRSTHRR